jgi:translocation and assembly module TamB
MMRWVKVLLAVLALVLLGLIALPAGLMIWANGEGGHQAMERLIAEKSGGRVKVSGVEGRFPDHLRIAHAEIADATGRWAIIDGLALDWSPLALLTGAAKIQLLSADHVQILRQPEAGAGSSSQSSSLSNGIDLPVRVSLGQLSIARLDLAQEAAGAPASLSISGTASLPAPDRLSARLAAKRLDGDGEYRVEGGYGSGGADLEITASEPAQGLIAQLADLPDLGTLRIRASLKGPSKDETLDLHIEAGDLRAQAQGKIDLEHRTLALDMTASAPAMTPRPDLSWKSARLEAHLQGRFDRPDADGHLVVESIASAGAALDRIEADLHGKDGKASIEARLFRLRTRGLPPDLLGSTPIEIKAETSLESKGHPIDFSLTHPVLRMTGKAIPTANPDISADIAVPDLAPFSTLAGMKVTGRAALTARLTGKGAVSLDGRIFEGEAERLKIAASGTIADVLDLRWSVSSPDLAKLGAPVAGSFSAKGTVRGRQEDFQATATAEGELEFSGMPKGPVSLSIEASGLPRHPNGKIDAHGQLAGAPLVLSAKADVAGNGATRIVIDQAHWKSAEASGSLSLEPKGDKASGKLTAKMTDLDDLSPLVGMSLKGSAEAALEIVDQGKVPQARIHAEVRQADWGGGRIDHLGLDGTIDDPLARPAAALSLALDGIAASGVTGKATLQVNGPTSALKIKLSVDLGTSSGPADLAAEGQADLDKSVLRLSSLQGTYARRPIRLLAPASLTYGAQIRIERLRLGIANAELEIDGQAAPLLALDATLKNGDLALIGGKGTLGIEAHLQGDPAAPSGDVHVAGRGLRYAGGPSASLDATAHLQGGMAHIDATLDSGKGGTLTLTGTAPIQSYAAIDLHASGSVDLTLLDPLLAADGREARGKISLDVGVRGTPDSPSLSGKATLDEVSFRDFAQGLRFTHIGGTLQTDGSSIQLINVSGESGPGTVKLEGHVDILAPGVPVDLTITGRNIRPLASDLMTADMDADLTVKGNATQKLTVGGKVEVSRADINIPDSLPPSVATLDVKKKGAPPPPPPQPVMVLALDVAVDAAQQIFVRGRGLDAEMGGKLQVGGTADDPDVGGGFDLRQGTFSLAGQSLTITRGRIGFDGDGPGGKLVPTLDITSESNSGGIDATLTVTGYADHPVIKLTSTPELPQDEILAHLLFNSSLSQLTPLQIASIAQAVASMAGAGGGFDPLALMRKTLGIDRLTVNSTSNSATGNSNTMVEAGKYVATGVYVGTRQGMSGGTQARVQIDITRHLKLDTTLGTGGGSPATGTTIDNDPGSSVGLTYQIEY